MHKKLQKYIPGSEFESRYDRLLQSCNCFTALKQIHSSLIITGCVTQYPHLTAQIIKTYCKYGYPNLARSLFDQIHHGHSSFLLNTMLRAYTNGGHYSETLQLYSIMRKTGIMPNNYTFPFALKACASKSISLGGKLVHSDVMKTGFDSDMFVEAALVDMYAKCGLIDDAHKVFDQMSCRDLVCWAAMITAYEQAHWPKEAIALFLKMQLEGLSADVILTVTVASAVGQLGDSKKARSVHAYSIRNSLVFDTCVKNSLIAMYGKCMEVKMARFVFDLMKKRDNITWNSMLSCYTQNGLPMEALSLFNQMQHSHIKPDSVTALIMVTASADLGSQEIGRKIHSFITDNKINMEPNLINALIDMYAKCGDLDSAVQGFNVITLGKCDTSSYNTLISSYGTHGFGKEAIELFSQMQEKGIQPNHITFTSLLSACSHAGLVDEGRKLFSNMEKDFSVKPEPKHYACIVDTLGRAGFLNEAYNLIKAMPIEPNHEIWGALLLACRTYGNTNLGEIAADNLFRLKPQDTGYYVLMSNIYAESRDWQEVIKVRQSMKNRGLQKQAAYSITSAAPDQSSNNEI